ncbi:MAG: YciI family protein [Methylococcus sp.]|jgi:uncharacterized protein YciI|nr:MAG: YciI family protein [Methylococcus sp.]
MLFAIMAEDHPGTLALRLENRPAHLARLRTLQEAGRLILAGPFPAAETEDPGDLGFKGTLIVAEFDSLSEAKAFIAADPYQQAGVFAEVRINPFKKVLPA